MESDKCCKECNKEFESYESVLRHVKVHSMKARDYVLKWKHGGKIPTCHCGCARNTDWNVNKRDFTDFIHGHHAAGRVKSDEEKAKIGKKNSENMKRWMSMHPEVAAKRGILMNKATLNPEVQKKKSESMARFWSTSPLAVTLRKEASERAIKLLSEGKIGPHAPFKTQWKMNPFTGAEEFMHSSWESAFLDTCIARGYPVTKEHGITIPYRHPDGSFRSYVPDFYALEDRTLYEVKGRVDECDEAKWESAAAWCREMGMRFEVLFSQIDSL